MTRKLILLPLAAIVGLQFFRQPLPEAAPTPHGDKRQHVATPPDVDAILRRACYDCHSSETRWPWYAGIVPIRSLVVGHVEHGRSHLDFSNWSTDPDREPTPDQRLRWICDTVRNGEMPLASYLLLHPSARLDAADAARLCAWSRSVRAVANSPR